MSRSLGSLRIDLVALTGKFESGMSKSIGALDKFGNVSNKVGALATGSLKKVAGAFASIASSVISVQGVLVGALAAIGVSRLVREFHEASVEVDTLGKKAGALGIAIEDLSALRFASGEAGVEFETLSKMVGKASKNISNFVREGGGPAGDAIERLGVNARAAAGGMRPIVELLPEIAAGFERITDAGERLSLSEAIFGREGGSQFIQWLEDSGGFMDNLADSTARASRLGVIFTAEQFDKLKAYNDAVGRISEAWRGLRVRLMVEVAPALTSIANRFAEFAAAIPRIFSTMFGGAKNLNPEDRAKMVAAVTALLDSLLDLFRIAGKSSGVIFLAGLRDALFVAPGILWAVAKNLGRELVIQIGVGMSDAIGGLAAMSRVPSIRAFFQSWGDSMLEGVAELRDQAKQETDAFVESLFDSETFSGGSLPQAIKRAGAELAAQLPIIGKAVDGVTDLANGIDGVGKATDKVGAATVKAAGSWSKFFDGMREAWKTLTIEANDFAALGGAVFSTFARGISEDLSKALASGEISFKNFGEAVGKILTNLSQQVLQMVLQFYILRAITGAAGSMFPGSTGPVPASIGGGGLPAGTGATYAAKGGAFGFASGGVASGVLGGPSSFAFSKKIGVAGEAGAEAAFAPLRKIGGELGVKSVGGDVSVQIIDQRGSGARPEVQSGKGPDGRRFVQILIRDEMKKAIGEGAFDKALAGSYGLSRRGTGR